MKTPEELKELKEEVETLNKKLAELAEEELKQVTGGGSGAKYDSCPNCGSINYIPAPCPTAPLGWIYHCMDCGNDWDPGDYFYGH